MIIYWTVRSCWLALPWRLTRRPAGERQHAGTVVRMTESSTSVTPADSGCRPAGRAPRRSRLLVAELDGPWLSAFVFEVPYPVRSKSNARRYRTKTGTRRTQAERAAAKAEKQFTSQTRELARFARPGSWELGPPPPASVSQRPVVVSSVIAHTLLDATNVPKSLLDACEKVIYHTDATVRGASQLTVRADGAGALVGFAQLAPGADVISIQRASLELASTTTRHAHALEWFERAAAPDQPGTSPAHDA